MRQSAPSHRPSGTVERVLASHGRDVELGQVAGVEVHAGLDASHQVEVGHHAPEMVVVLAGGAFVDGHDAVDAVIGHGRGDLVQIG
jgi:hypothetical protein